MEEKRGGHRCLVAARFPGPRLTLRIMLYSVAKGRQTFGIYVLKKFLCPLF